MESKYLCEQINFTRHKISSLVINHVCPKYLKSETNFVSHEPILSTGNSSETSLVLLFCLNVMQLVFECYSSYQ